MTNAELTNEELKSNIISKLDSMNREQLVALHTAVAKLLADELMASFSDEWAQGKITRERIQEAIDEHRKQHPYEAPHS